MATQVPIDVAVSEMPTLATKRLLIRPFEMEDLPDVHRILDIELRTSNLGSEKMETRDDRAEWLKWTVLNYSQLAKLHQPPYGDRAVVLRSTALLIGACGFVPCLNPFEQLPSLAPETASDGESYCTTEFGLFYAISPAHQRQGYAAEATQALVEYAFQHLLLKRILATTEYDNVASLGVMRKLGMKIDRNPRSQPAWLQAVGILENKHHPA
jgi:RimJ/RimL family protein N-acetyltransferase